MWSHWSQFSTTVQCEHPPLITSVSEPCNVKEPLTETEEVGTDDPDEAVDIEVKEDTNEGDFETGGRNGTLAVSFPCTTAGSKGYKPVE